MGSEILEKLSKKMLTIQTTPDTQRGEVCIFSSPITHILLFLSCGVVLQERELAVFHQFVQHKTIVRCFRSIPHFPICQQIQIIRQPPEAEHFVLPELTDTGMFWLVTKPL